jgi:hypothetical protein
MNSAVEFLARGAGGITSDETVDVSLISQPRHIVFEVSVGGRPRYIVKCSREPELTDNLQSEWQCLERVAALELARGADLAAARPVQRAKLFGRDALIMEFAPGKPNHQELSSSASIHKMIEWLILLASRSADAVVDLELARDAVRQAGAVLPSLVPLGLDWLNTSGIDTMPFIVSHGDLSYLNILIDGPRWTIIDWECGNARRGIPLHDVFDFLIYLEDGGGRAAFAGLRAILDGRPPRAHLEAFTKYAAALNINNRAAVALLLLYCANKSLGLARNDTGKSKQKLLELADIVSGIEPNRLRLLPN